MSNLDPRLNAFRDDLADARLEGRVDAGRFVEGRRMQVSDPIVSVRKAPRFDAMQLTQALLGETVVMLEDEEGWAWCQLERDGYVGYLSVNGLSPDIMVPTHRVSVPSTLLYPATNLKTQPAIIVTLNAVVTVTADDGKFSRLSNGHFIYSAHLKPVDVKGADFVAIAQMFRHAPYYWGGKSVHGLDCSGLVQVALEACGGVSMRDSDMQEAALGSTLMLNDLDGLKRGDLVFWTGHVGIMTDHETLLHANGHHMMVVEEPLRDAVKRIAHSYGQITSLKRL